MLINLLHNHTWKIIFDTVRKQKIRILAGVDCTNPIGCCVFGGGTKPCDWLCSRSISLPGAKRATFLESAKNTVQRHQDLLNIHELSLCRSRIGDWAEGRGCVSYGAGRRLYCAHTHTHLHTQIHTTAEHIVHTGLSATSNAIQENLEINEISWRVTVSGESEVKWLFFLLF